MIYDFIQKMAGSRQGLKILHQELSRLPPRGQVLDIGAGTGSARPLFGPGWGYVGLEPDPKKLRDFRRKHPRETAWEGSACAIPAEDGRFDLCLLVAVAHHLDDDQLGRALRQAQRVLKPSGRCLLVDPLWEPSNLAGRLLWSIDRGAFPRRAEDLLRILGAFFHVETSRRYRIHHDYLLAWAGKIPVPSAGGPQSLQTA